MYKTGIFNRNVRTLRPDMYKNTILLEEEIYKLGMDRKSVSIKTVRGYLRGSIDRIPF